MAMAAFHITAPAIAAAVGFYFLGKIDSKELSKGQRVVATKLGDKVIEKVKDSQIPKLAPQFDGLYIFETLVD